MYRIIETDNFGGDYPGESFYGPRLREKSRAEAIADLMNEEGGPHSARYYRVVDADYKLSPGQEAMFPLKKCGECGREYYDMGTDDGTTSSEDATVPQEVASSFRRGRAEKSSKETRADSSSLQEMDMVSAYPEMQRGRCPTKSSCLSCDRLGYHLEPSSTAKASGCDGCQDCEPDAVDAVREAKKEKA